jgi:hypothetical protein
MPLLIGTRKCLLNGARKRGYRFDFAAGLPSSVVAGLGTVGVDGGALVATGIANRGYNEVANNEFTVDVAGWSSTAGVVPSRVDTQVDPGSVSGGSDAWALKGVKNGGVITNLTGFPIASVIGATYALSARCYSPSGNATSNAAGVIFRESPLGWATRLAAYTTSEDVWQDIAIQGGVATTTNAQVGLCITGTMQGDIGYYDAITCQRQNAVAWMPPVGVNLQLPVALAMPAAPDVVPFDIIVRGADALNYWAVRVMPNTAGNDTEIIEVVAGVETVRAAADVDWTAGGTDYVLLDVRGPALTVYAMKQGASVWTAAASYATMATQLTSTGIGVQYFGTTAGPTLVDWAPRAL